VQRDDVRRGEQFGKRHLRHAEIRANGVRYEIICDYLAAKTAHDPGDTDAAARGSSDTHGATMQVETDQTIECVITFAQRARSSRQGQLSASTTHRQSAAVCVVRSRLK